MEHCGGNTDDIWGGERLVSCSKKLSAILCLCTRTQAHYHTNTHTDSEWALWLLTVCRWSTGLQKIGAQRVSFSYYRTFLSVKLCFFQSLASCLTASSGELQLKNPQNNYHLDDPLVLHVDLWWWKVKHKSKIHMWLSGRCIKSSQLMCLYFLFLAVSRAFLCLFNEGRYFAVSRGMHLCVTLCAIMRTCTFLWVKPVCYLSFIMCPVPRCACASVCVCLCVCVPAWPHLWPELCAE